MKHLSRSPEYPSAKIQQALRKHSRLVLNCVRKASQNNTQSSKTTTKRKLKYIALVKGFCSPAGVLSAITLLHYQCLLTATRLQYFFTDKVLKSMAGFLPSDRTGNTKVNGNKFLIKSLKL